MSSSIAYEQLNRARNWPEDFGCVGDSAQSGGGTDNTSFLQNALNEAATIVAMQKSVIVPGGRLYRITSGITIPVGVSLIMQADSCIIYDGSANEAAITIGEQATRNFRTTHRINVKRAASSDWSSESSVGVRLINPVNCDIEIARAEGFTIGCQFAAYLACAYNYGIKLGYFIGNKYGIDLRSFDPSGFPNENSFVGGRFSYTTGENTGKSRYGIRLSRESGCYTDHNNNTFYSPTFELSNSQASPGSAICVLIEVNGTHNRFLNYRSEGNTNPCIIESGSEAGRNVFQPSYDNLGVPIDPTGTIASTSNRRTYALHSPEMDLLTQTASEWNSGDLVSQTTQKSSGGFDLTHTIGVHWETAGGGGATSLVSALHLTNDGTYLTPTGSTPAVGIVVDTTKNKRFVARKLVDPNAPGKFAVRCYDGHPLDGGAIITSGADGLVRGITSGQDTTWVSDQYGGTYQRGSDTDADWFFSVDDSVKYIVLLCRNAAVAAFSIGTPDPFPLRCFPLHGVNDGHRYCSAMPDTGTYRTGDFVLNSAKTSAASSPLGWYNASSGFVTIIASEPSSARWESGDLPTRTTQRTSGGFEFTNTIGIHWEKPDDPGTTTIVKALHLTNDGEYLVPTGASPSAGIVVDCRTNKRFIARRNADSSVNSGGRFNIRCYDGHPLEGGAIITSGASLVTVGSGTAVSWASTEFGGSYQQNSDNLTPLQFTVDDSVKYIVLLNRNAAINSFSIETLDGLPIHCFPLHGINDGLRRLDAIPDTGIYHAGDVVYHSDPSSADSSELCWIYTGSTWLPCYRGRSILTASISWTPGLLGNGQTASEAVTVTGAGLGDIASASFTDLSLPGGMILTADVVNTNTVQVQLYNVSAGDQTLTPTLKVQVLK